MYQIKRDSERGMEVGGCMSRRLLLSITGTSSNLGMTLLPGKSLNTVTKGSKLGRNTTYIYVIVFYRFRCIIWELKTILKAGFQTCFSCDA